MVFEIILAVYAVETVRSLIWTVKGLRQIDERCALEKSIIGSTKNLGFLIEQYQELRRTRPDLYEEIPRPISVRIVHHFKPQWR